MDDFTFDLHDVLTLDIEVFDALRVPDDTFVPVAVEALVTPGGEHVQVGPYAFDPNDARALAAAILRAADALDRKEILG
jgi:hypothetical protein